MPTREEMVERQLRARGIEDERVLAAMAAVPREDFLEPGLKPFAYDDRALPIGFAQTLSQPWIVAAICQALELTGDERVLEVGGGSGYSAAVLSRLAASILSVELVGELATAAAERLRELGITNVEVRAGDAATAETVSDSGFDGIAIHAAVPRLPGEIVRRVREGGRIVAPVAAGSQGEMLRAYRRVGDRDGQVVLTATDISPARFVPLRGVAGFDGP